MIYVQLSGLFSQCSQLEPVLVYMLAVVVSLHNPPIAATAAIPTAVLMPYLRCVYHICLGHDS